MDQKISEKQLKSQGFSGKRWPGRYRLPQISRPPKNNLNLAFSGPRSQALKVAPCLVNSHCVPLLGSTCLELSTKPALEKWVLRQNFRIHKTFAEGKGSEKKRNRADWERANSFTKTNFQLISSELSYCIC